MKNMMGVLFSAGRADKKYMYVGIIQDFFVCFATGALSR